MSKIKTAIFVGVTSLTLATSGAKAASHGNGLKGSTVVVTNTFQGAQTENAEVDVTLFKLTNNLFSKVSNSVEFPDFITLYSIDIGSDSIAFEWIKSPFADQLSGPTPEGNHDRNTFVFDLPEGVTIEKVEFDSENSDLLADSALPTATVVGANKIVTDFSTGVVRGVGFNPRYKITFK